MVNMIDNSDILYFMVNSMSRVRVSLFGKLLSVYVVFVLLRCPLDRNN